MPPTRPIKRAAMKIITSVVVKFRLRVSIGVTFVFRLLASEVLIALLTGNPDSKTQPHNVKQTFREMDHEKVKLPTSQRSQKNHT
jgi:hypothetical protein